jgi:hypothetical protein
MKRISVLILLTCIGGLFCVAQEHVVSSTEPGRLALKDLYKAADTVAVVRIVSGDTENYQTALYKGLVITPYKGVTAGATVYLAPYVGLRLGWEYLLFLRSAKTPATPKEGKTAVYGIVPYGLIFNEGYSSMETSYECVFDGEEISEQCDYAIRVCTDYITLPKELPTFPPIATETPFGCRRVRRSQLEKVLARFAGGSVSTGTADKMR